MTKTGYQYKLRLEGLTNPVGEAMETAPLEIVFQNHDDIFKIIEMAQDKKLFVDSNEGVEFAIGLKLFSEVMLKNRNYELFQEFVPAFKGFMMKLKSM